MKVVIVEDEPLAAERLQMLLLQCEPGAQVLERFDTVADTALYFNEGKSADLLFMDIQLADGKSFEVFSKASIDVPIIFTTAYDQYAISAFKFHSLDYLLKPVQLEDVAHALEKFKKVATPRNFLPEEITALKELAKTHGRYKERFLIKSGNKLQYKETNQIAFFFAEGKNVFLITRPDGRQYLIDHSLEELEKMLTPHQFFRINRKYVVSLQSIAEVRGSVSTKMEIKLHQPSEHQLTVSRDRAQDFKNWLNG